MIPDLLSSIIVSGLGAALAFLAARTWRVWRLMRLRQLCSIDGAFVTQFERHEGGEVIIQQALTQLSQIGLRVRGVTTEVGTDRSWELNGEINESGFLSGTHTATEAGAVIVKELLLAIDKKGTALTGLWTTCDPMLRRVTTGQYAMRRCLEAAPEAGR